MLLLSQIDDVHLSHLIIGKQKVKEHLNVKLEFITLTLFAALTKVTGTWQLKWRKRREKKKIDHAAAIFLREAITVRLWFEGKYGSESIGFQTLNLRDDWLLEFIELGASCIMRERDLFTF